MNTIGITTLLILGLASASAQVTISLNWKEFAGGVNDVLDGYGVVSANNWQNLQQVTSGTDIVTSAGTTSTVDFTATAAGGFDTFEFGVLNNTPMRAGMASFSSSTGPTITLSGLNATFSSYDVIVYVGGFNAASNQGSVTDGVTTYYYSVPNPFTTALTQSTDTNIGDGADVATYVRFNGLTADTTTISLLSPNSTGVGIGGIQITGTAVPEPSTYALLGGFVALALVLRRRLSR